MTDLSNLPEHLVIAIDGPAGSGKSTMASRLADSIGGIKIDTGAMYRSVAAKTIENNVDTADTEAVSGIAEKIGIEFIREGHAQHIIIDGADYTSRIREPDVNALVSIVAAIPGVRKSMVKLQREMGAKGRVVMEGRDIGSNVFPNAEFKFFLVADDTVRAGRRVKEMDEAGVASTHENVLENLKERDKIDSSRAESPLVKPQNAIEIDTSQMDIDEVLQTMLDCLVSKG